MRIYSRFPKLLPQDSRYLVVDGLCDVCDCNKGFVFFFFFFIHFSRPVRSVSEKRPGSQPFDGPPSHSVEMPCSPSGSGLCGRASYLTTWLQRGVGQVGEAKALDRTITTSWLARPGFG